MMAKNIHNLCSAFREEHKNVITSLQSRASAGIMSSCSSCRTKKHQDSQGQMSIIIYLHCNIQHCYKTGQKQEMHRGKIQRSKQ